MTRLTIIISFSPRKIIFSPLIHKCCTIVSSFINTFILIQEFRIFKWPICSVSSFGTIFINAISSFFTFNFFICEIFKQLNGKQIDKQLINKQLINKQLIHKELISKQLSNLENEKNNKNNNCIDKQQLFANKNVSISSN